MESKIKSIILIGFIQLIGLLIIRSSTNDTVSFMGYHGYKLGNRTVLIKPIEGTVIITDQKEIEEYFDSDRYIYFAIIGDSLHSDYPKVSADHLKMGTIDTIEKLVDLLEQDTTITIIDRQVSDRSLIIRQKKYDDELDETNYMIAKYIDCYPYYLRLIHVWKDTETAPPKLFEILSSVGTNK